MTYKVNGTNAIDNNRKGTFAGVNLGSYTPSNRPSATAGDIIYNSTVKSIEVYDGSAWKIAGGGSGITPYASGGTVLFRSDTLPSGTGNHYYYHIFTSTGTFTASTNLSNVGVVCVGGGGAGGGQTGGGGAGGVVSAFNALSNVSAGTYTVTIGAGGAGSYNSGGDGGTTSFGNLVTATGGGGGGGGSSNGRTGGNGGGGGGNTYGTTSGGSGQTVGSGPLTFAGFTGGGGDNLSGGGGAGAGGVGGTAPTSSDAGNHTTVPAGIGGQGAGLPFTPTAMFGRVAGGGGGGRNGNARPPGFAVGKHGGGQGLSPNASFDGGSPAGSAVRNSGGGGGGGAQGNATLRNGGNGASGFVIIRYPTGNTTDNTAQ